MCFCCQLERDREATVLKAQCERALVAGWDLNLGQDHTKHLWFPPLATGGPEFQMDTAVCVTDLLSGAAPLYLMFPYTENRTTHVAFVRHIPYKINSKEKKKSYKTKSKL